MTLLYCILMAAALNVILGYRSSRIKTWRGLLGYLAIWWAGMAGIVYYGFA